MTPWEAVALWFGGFAVCILIAVVFSAPWAGLLWLPIVAWVAIWSNRQRCPRCGKHRSTKDVRVFGLPMTLTGFTTPDVTTCSRCGFSLPPIGGP